MGAGAEGEGWARRTLGPAGLAMATGLGAPGSPLPRPGAPPTPGPEAQLGPRPLPRAQVNRSEDGAGPGGREGALVTPRRGKRGCAGLGWAGPTGQG